MVRASFYTHQTRCECAGVCACVNTYQMEKTATKYFNPEALVKEIQYLLIFLFLFWKSLMLIKLNNKIDSLLIFGHNVLYTGYRDSITFLKNLNSVIEVLKTFDQFSLISGLKPESSKYETAGIGNEWYEVH